MKKMIDELNHARIINGLFWDQQSSSKDWSDLHLLLPTLGANRGTCVTRSCISSQMYGNNWQFSAFLFHTLKCQSLSDNKNRSFARYSLPSSTTWKVYNFWNAAMKMKLPINILQELTMAQSFILPDDRSKSFPVGQRCSKRYPTKRELSLASCSSKLIVRTQISGFETVMRIRQSHQTSLRNREKLEAWMTRFWLKQLHVQHTFKQELHPFTADPPRWRGWYDESSYGRIRSRTASTTVNICNHSRWARLRYSRYTCLSYCWGNPHATGNFFDFNKRFADEYSQEVQYPIACDGKLIFVRANLYEALQQLPDSPGLELKTEGDSERRCTLLHAAAQEGNMEAIKL